MSKKITSHDEESEENLPVKGLLPNVTIPEPIDLKISDGIEDTQKANISMYNTRIAVVHALWSQANSFGKALALLNEFDKLIKLRCEIMGHPHGATPVQSAKGGTIYPTN